MRSSIIFRLVVVITLLTFPVIGFASGVARDSLIIQQEKKNQEKAKGKKTETKTETKPETKPAVKPEITTVPKARKQSRPKVVKPVTVVKPIKVIKPKIKKP